jgi:hypothetical protein
VTLPPLAGSRPAAAALLARLPADLTGQHVAVLARDLLTGSASFADELVRELAVDRNAAEVVIVGAEPEFEQYVQAAARSHSVGPRVSTRGQDGMPPRAAVRGDQ